MKTVPIVAWPKRPMPPACLLRLYPVDAYKVTVTARRRNAALVRSVELFS